MTLDETMKLSVCHLKTQKGDLASPDGSKDRSFRNKKMLSIETVEMELQKSREARDEPTITADVAAETQNDLALLDITLKFSSDAASRRTKVIVEIKNISDKVLTGIKAYFDLTSGQFVVHPSKKFSIDFLSCKY